MPFPAILSSWWNTVSGSKAPGSSRVVTPHRPFEDYSHQLSLPSTTLAQTQAVIQAQEPTSTPVSSGHDTTPVVTECDHHDGITYREQGQPRFVPGTQELVLSQRGRYHDAVIRDEYLLRGTRIISHLPLGPKDAPGAPNRDLRERFRNLIDEVNILDRVHPDIETAKQHGWQEQVNKLNRKVAHLERSIRQRLAKDANSSAFKEMMPDFPRLWKYLDPLLRATVQNQAAARKHTPLPRRRRIKIPAPVEEEEDNKATITASMDPENPPELISQQNGTHSFTLIKQEGDQIQTSQLASQVPEIYVAQGLASYRDAKIKTDVDGSGLDDCVYISKHPVGARGRNTRPRRSRTRRTRQPVPTVAKLKSIIPTRSSRSRDVPLVARQRSRSPPQCSQAHRDRSPRRDATVERLSVSELW